jgi:hypothetical protein
VNIFDMLKRGKKKLKRAEAQPKLERGQKKLRRKKRLDIIAPKPKTLKTNRAQNYVVVGDGSPPRYYARVEGFFHHKHPMSKGKAMRLKAALDNRYYGNFNIERV